MRTHAQIIRDAGGPQAFHDRLGLQGRIFAVRSWAFRDSIPADQWRCIADAKLATLDELATAAAGRSSRPEAA